STLSGNYAHLGGAIYSCGNLTLSGCTVSANTANSSGGGLETLSGTATIVACTFTGNVAQLLFGGAIHNHAGTLTLSGSTLTQNSADYGGAIFNKNGLVQLLSGNTISANTATLKGGGIWNVGTATISGSTLANNSTVNGGGIYNTTSATINDHGVT